MATVSLNSLKKSYGRDEVLHGIDIDIADRELVVVVGPSGCGKSTLLRMIAGLETVTSGEVLIDGVNVNHEEPMDRNIAMVFQNYALYPHMTVFNNMAYSLKIAGTPKAEIKERVERAAELLQLSEYLQRKPRQLSGGQRQRVAMGRAIVRRPAVFLFDEPLSNLDAKLRVQMRLEIRKLQRDLGVTAVYVTHDQVEAMTLGDRLVVLNDGNLEQFGTPIELYQRPASLFVASFIGSPAMNFFDGTADGTQVVLDCGVTIDTGIVATGRIVVGVRPEHFVVDSNGAFQVHTSMLEQLGSNTLLHGVVKSVVKDGAATDDHAVVVSLPGIHTEAMVAEGIRVTVAASELHLFDAAGKRLSSHH